MDGYIVKEISWRGVPVEIRWRSKWMGFDDIDHLEIRSERVLPVTSSGFTSHFVLHGEPVKPAKSGQKAWEEYEAKMEFYNWQRQFKNTRDEAKIEEFAVAIIDKAAKAPGNVKYWKGRRGPAIPRVDGQPPSLLDLDYVVGTQIKLFE